MLESERRFAIFSTNCITRKLRKTYFTRIILIILMCVLPIITILMIHHITLSETLTKMGTGSFGDSYSYITMENTDNNNHLLKNSLKKLIKKYAIYLDDTSDENVTIRYIFFNESFPNLPIKNGRFFRKTDFVDGNKVAVIGKNVEGIYDKDGKKCILIKGEEYVVLGTIGYEDDTVLDNYIFANLFGGQDCKEKLYVLDFFSATNAGNISDSCVKVLNKNDCKAEQLVVGESYTTSIMPIIQSSTCFICVLGCCILCIFLISLQWISEQRKELCIQRLVGATKKQVFLYILKQYIGIICLSFIVGFIYCTIFFPAYFVSLLNGYLISFFILIVFMIGTLNIVLKDSIEEAIK